MSGYCHSKIQRIIKYYLTHPPSKLIINSEGCYLIFDGTFLRKRKGMYAAMDGLTHKIIYGEYGINEGPIDLMYFCLLLKQSGIEPKSVTIDGNLHIFRIIKQVWSDSLIQRCIVHIQRQGLSWCRQKPTRTDAKLLRNIFLRVYHIHSQTEKQIFINEFKKWDEVYGQNIIHGNEDPESKDLRKARSMLLKAIPFMFTYLEDNKIPNTTNAIEGYFSRLKQRYRQHKGLSKKHQEHYFKWYFYLCQK